MFCFSFSCLKKKINGKPVSEDFYTVWECVGETKTLTLSVVPQQASDPNQGCSAVRVRLGAAVNSVCGSAVGTRKPSSR